MQPCTSAADVALMGRQRFPRPNVHHFSSSRSTVLSGPLLSWDTLQMNTRGFSIA
jgi:hypothetical protein